MKKTSAEAIRIIKTHLSYKIGELVHVVSHRRSYLVKVIDNHDPAYLVVETSTGGQFKAGRLNVYPNIWRTHEHSLLQNAF